MKMFNGKQNVDENEMFDLLLEYQESLQAGLCEERLDNLSPC